MTTLAGASVPGGGSMHHRRRAELRALGLAPLIVGMGIFCFLVQPDVDEAGGPARAIVTAVAGMVLVGVGCLLLVSWRCRSNDRTAWVSLGPVYVTYFTFAFGITALAWLKPQGGSRSVVDPSGIPGAVALAAIALSAWTGGYLLGPSRILLRAGRGLRRSLAPEGSWKLRFVGLPVALFAVSLGARLLRLSTDRFGYLQDAGAALSSPSSLNQLLAMFEGLSRYALVLAALDALVLSQSLRSRATLVLLAVLEIGIGLFAASKETVLLTFVVLGLVAISTRRRIARSVIALAIALVLLLFPFNSQYRATIRDGTAAVPPATAVAALPRVMSDTVVQSSVRSFFVDAPAQVSARLRQIDNLAIIRQRTPDDIGFRPWTELFVGPVIGLVPRAIWPEKPILSTGRDFSIDYYEIPPTIVTAAAVTPPGDLYRHGGLLPVVIGMAVIGVVARTIDRVFDPRRDLRLLIPFVPFFTLLLKSESDVTALVLGLLQTTILSVVVCRLVFASRRR